MEEGICLLGFGVAGSLLRHGLRRLKTWKSYLLAAGSAVAFVMLIMALFTDHWLSLRAVWAVQPHSGKVIGVYESQNLTELVQREKNSFSGLWRVCCGEDDCIGTCRSLKSSINSDTQTSSSSLYVIGVLRRTNVFPVVSTLLAFSGCVFLTVGLFWENKHHILSLAGGVHLVISGLTNVLGIIIFISSNDKLSKRKSSRTEYNWSFYCAGMAFIVTEILGVIIIQELVKSVETTNDSKIDDVNIQVEEAVSHSSSIVTKNRNLAIPPSVNLRRSVRRKSRSSMCFVDNGVNDLLEPGNVLDQDESDELASIRVESTRGLPCSDSGYNGASSFNLKRNAEIDKETLLHRYTSLSDLEGSNDEDNDLVDDICAVNQLKLPTSSTNLQHPTIIPSRRPQSLFVCQTPMTNNTMSTLSCPPPVEFQTDAKRFGPSDVNSPPSHFCQTVLPREELHRHRRQSSLDSKSGPKQIRPNTISHQFTRKYPPRADSSFDSILSSPATVDSGVQHVGGQETTLAQTGRTAKRRTKSPDGSVSAQMSNKERRRIEKWEGRSPVVKTFRSKLFTKQSWIKSRDEDIGQSRESDDVELRTVDRVTDSGYRSSGTSSEGKGTYSLPRIRSQGTFPDGLMQITRYDQYHGKVVKHDQPSWQKPYRGHDQKFTSSNSSLTHALRRSSSTGYLQDQELRKKIIKDQSCESVGRNHDAFYRPEVWQGPVTAL